MKISSYSLELSGSSLQKTVESEQMNLKAWVDSSKPGKQDNLAGSIVLNLSEEGKNLAQQAHSLNDTDEITSLSESNEDHLDYKQKLISDFIYILTGKRLKFVNISLKDVNGTSVNTNINTPNRVGWGVDFNYQHSYSEESQVSFSAKGLVRTSDGREMQLELNLNMSRTFYSQTSLSFKAGDALLDPLIINLGAAPVNLTNKKISFDINIDGNNENISLPDSSSGFLALDKNKNGIIDDGSELFGPQSGNGFKELSKYDEDNNGWIDENDSVYDNLQIWQHDDSGNSSLIALGKSGIGAIYLNSAQTDFKYADDQNNTQGFLRRSGIYLRENGTAGTIQHIDLAI